MPVQSDDKCFTNFQMEQMAEQLTKLLKRDDIIGYVAACNYHNLIHETEGFSRIKNKLIIELGTEETTSDGTGSGNFSISVDTPEFETFQKKIKPIGAQKCYPKLFYLKPEECIDRLTGEQMLSYEWMIDFDQEVHDK